MGEESPLPSDLLTSKLYIPPLRPNLVSRPRLVRRLNDGLKTARRLTLVSAPAGFGKTTLILAWLKECRYPAAWLALDEADNDLPRFLTYLAAAFQQVDEEIGGPLLNALQSPQLPSIEKLMTALLNEIALRSDPLILVMDDFHLLTETAIFEATDFLLRHQPPQLHLALITREDPILHLSRLRARDQLTEIRAWDLRFTPEETDEFLREVMGLELSRQEVAALEDRTEGWVVGVQLAGLSIQKQPDRKAFIADFSGSNRHILDYLTDEVIRQQPEHIREFLLQTAVLDRLCGPLCDALTGRTDSGEVLAHLEAANLFVIPLDDERLWYRYHHLFSELLRSQLKRLHPQLAPELHRRAGRWYEEIGDIRSAVEHALQDPDRTGAARLIERQVFPKLYQGEVAMVLGWFDRLPQDALDANPMLCVGKAWALALMQRGTRRGDVDLALQGVEHALKRSMADDALSNLASGHTTSIRAFLLQSPELSGAAPEDLISLSREAQRLLPEDEKAIRSVNWLNIGFGYLALADLDAAAHAFRQTLEDGLAGGNLYAAVYGPIGLAVCAVLVGNLGEALQLCKTYIDRFNRILAGQYFPPIGALYILKGSILLEFDLPADAEQPLLEGLDLIRWTGEYEAHQKGYTALARLRAMQGDSPAATAALESLEDAWPEGAFYVRALRHRLLIRNRLDDEDARQARSWLVSLGLEHRPPEVIRSVDPISEAHFETYLSAAQVLARLVEASPGSYRLDSMLDYLLRQQDFYASRGIVAWAVAAAITRTLLYRAAGMRLAALESLEAALVAAEPTGLFRIFVDECESLQDLLEELKPRLANRELASYASRLLGAMTCKPVAVEIAGGSRDLLSDREREVLLQLAKGLTYEEIGRLLFLSLNTVQFHVKNIYRKLLVNRRAQAVEKARELSLI